MQVQPANKVYHLGHNRGIEDKIREFNYRIALGACQYNVSSSCQKPEGSCVVRSQKASWR